ncbi:MAG: SMR family transporter [Actinomycetota bacterium]
MIWLGLTIILDAIATSSSRLSHGFTVPAWAGLTLLAYLGVLITFSKAITVLPLGTSYATYSGVGTVAIATIGCLAFGDHLRPTTLLGVALVVTGIIVLNLSGTRTA